jgi:hypothetical protein
MLGKAGSGGQMSMMAILITMILGCPKLFSGALG